MTAIPRVKLWIIQPSGISAEGQAILQKVAQEVEFKVGQPLSVGRSITNKIFLITWTSCSFVERGQFHHWLCCETSIVGLASILWAQGCEEVAASTESGILFPTK